MKILIVDDEPLIRRSLEKAFRRVGHEVRSANDGDSGLLEWSSWEPEVVMADILMPKMTGPEMIQAFGPVKTAKIVLMTAYAADLETLCTTPPDLFLRKPFEDILSVVKSVEELVRV